MKIALQFGCAYIIFVSGAGFLFGQAFFGQFTLGATMAGMAGLAGGILAFLARERIIKRAPFTLAVCVVCLVGVLLDVRHHYANHHSENNRYAWDMIGPYLFAVLALILGEIFRWGYPVVSTSPTDDSRSGE